jgi:Pyruvate/2-oxoacid:ferredoxin oxidoreductase delta subunit
LNIDNEGFCLAVVFVHTLLLCSTILNKNRDLKLITYDFCRGCDPNFVY